MAKSFKNELRIKVILLTYEHLILSYRKESTVEDVFHEVCNALELEERDLFGLAVLSAENYLFLDPRERLKKINFSYLSLMKACKRNGNPLRSNSAEACLPGKDSVSITLTTEEYPVVYFRVRFYIPIHCLRDRSTQHIYYEQLRTNVLEYGLYCDLQSYLHLGGFALQAEYGNAPSNVVTISESDKSFVPNYFDPGAIYPQRLIQEYGVENLLRWTLKEHVALRNMVACTAEFAFIRSASKHTSDFNLHLQSLPRMNRSHFSVCLGVSPEGISLYRQPKDAWIWYTNTIRWSEIDHLSHKDNIFLVHMNEKRVVRKFYLNHSLTAKHLFAMVGHMHQYQATAELSARHAAGLLEQIERGPYEERKL
ncbi:hypothetical protein P879_00506 [Paragonimus westermani]|uniref:FERM domain-containing protein n=1 Tax=Paragonimus westermani TaxID=34504 RepID=A0A8T0DYC1_9TREM|nr:hypothetical protein P879_00506 [Paragonimus westermani]